MKKGVTNMVRKPSAWARAAEQFRKSWRLMVAQLSSAVADEETRIARMELDGQLERIAVSPNRKE
jgi:hypothetical protein